MTDWKDWYFERAGVAPTPTSTDLMFNKIKAGCSTKMLAQIAEGVLDKDDPREVEWRFLRPAHIWLKREALDRRTMGSAMSNCKRLVSKGLQRRVNPWFLHQMGWSQPKVTTPLEVTGEDAYAAIELAAVEGLPEDQADGIRAILRLMYYAGLTQGQCRGLVYRDVIFSDGRVFIYKTGRLIDLPDHVRLPLMSWMRTRRELFVKYYKKFTKPPGMVQIFQKKHKAAAASFPKLSETYKGLKKLSA